MGTSGKRFSCLDDRVDSTTAPEIIRTILRRLRTESGDSAKELKHDRVMRMEKQADQDSLG